MRILIAEDDRTSRMLLSAVLRKTGYEVVETVNGAEAWELLQKPDAPMLAILDWMMPEMDGLEVVRRVRAAESNRSPYLIMLTARGEKSDLISGLGAGANDYLCKPFDPGELRARVEVGRRMVGMQMELDMRNVELLRWHDRMEHELLLAGKVQRQLLSTAPVFTPDYEAFFAYRPSMSIGGDFFDAFALPDGRLCIYIGDVSGHGVAPALISTFLKMTTTDLIRDHVDEGPAAVCRALNRYMHEHKLSTDLFATLFLGIYDPRTNRWIACNCGHPVPILVGADGKLRKDAIPDGGDMPLGVVDLPGQYGPDAEIEWTEMPGDVLMLFTDGTYETRHAETSDPCDLPNLENAVVEMVRRQPMAPSPSVVLDVLAEQGYRLDEDDCCAVTVRTSTADLTLLRQNVDCTMEAVHAIAFACEQALRKAKWPGTVGAAVRLLLMEYAVNIIRHGHALPRDHFHCCLQLRGNSCLLFIRDNGPSWDFPGRLARSGSATDDDESGRGLDIVKTIAQRIDFFRMELYNYARFVVERPDEPEHENGPEPKSTGDAP
jgi:phosphoserine phosphatase RsbU/P